MDWLCQEEINELVLFLWAIGTRSDSNCSTVSTQHINIYNKLRKRVYVQFFYLEKYKH